MLAASGERSGEGEGEGEGSSVSGARSSMGGRSRWRAPPAVKDCATW